MSDPINHPTHYTNREHECIDEMIAVFGTEAVIDFCKCNAWKYRYRAGSKGDCETDLAKSDWYISKAMELQGIHIVKDPPPFTIGDISNLPITLCKGEPQ